MEDIESPKKAKIESIDDQMDSFVKRKKHLNKLKKSYTKRKNYLKKVYSKRGQKCYKTEDKIKIADRNRKEKSQYENENQTFVIIKETRNKK